MGKWDSLVVHLEMLFWRKKSKRTQNRKTHYSQSYPCYIKLENSLQFLLDNKKSQFFSLINKTLIKTRPQITSQWHSGSFFILVVLNACIIDVLVDYGTLVDIFNQIVTTHYYVY